MNMSSLLGMAKVRPYITHTKPKRAHTNPHVLVCTLTYNARTSIDLCEHACPTYLALHSGSSLVLLLLQRSGGVAGEVLGAVRPIPEAAAVARNPGVLTGGAAAWAVVHCASLLPGVKASVRTSVNVRFVTAPSTSQQGT